MPTLSRIALRAGLPVLLAASLYPSDAAAQKFVTAPGPGGPPAVRVVDASGTDTTFFAYDPAFPGGVRVALGDVNGDGVLDIITGAGPGGSPHVRVWDGTTLAEIPGSGFYAYDAAFPGGVYVAAGDVNGDGRADIITGAGTGGGPHVRIWDGASFTEIAGFFAYDPAFPGGVNVAAGDMDGDGLAEIITGAGPGGGPHVRVWSGATFTEIDGAGFFAYDPAFLGGVNVAAGDVDGDGLADIVTGAGPGGGPHVRVWSGATFTEIDGSGFFAYDPAFAGGVTVGLSDLDRDGRNEIVTGPMTGMPIVRIWTGTTHTLLGEYLAFDPAAGAGVFIGSAEKNPPTDDAPRVAATIPVDGATNVAVGADLVVTFSEPVNVTPAAFELQCGSPIAIMITTASPASQFTLHPASPLPPATSCTLRIVGSGVTDDDPDDPPDRMAGDTTISFTTSACPTITVSPTSVPGGMISVAYAPVAFTQVGGTAPTTWSLTSGTLPTGMNLSSAGVLDGTPTQAGAFPLTITATAAGGCTGAVSLTLNIASAPNVAPSFTAGANQTVLEDAGAQTVTPWATSISPGPPDEAAQTLTFNITGNTNAALFSAGPAVSPTGTLTYTPAPNANGSATITLVLQDNGGTAGGGSDTSAPQSFTITVTAVNDAPSFTVGPNESVAENSGAHTVNPWATAISAGPANEAGQTLTFNVTGNTTPTMFSVAPAVSPTGVLTYTLAASQSGVATITLTLSDNGGTASGGVNTSAPQTFTITVTGVDDPPTADNDSYTAAEGGTLTVPAPGVLDGDVDPEGDTPITAVLVTGPANASSFTLNSDGSFTYTHDGSETTTDSFTYRAVANGLQSAPATVTITITAVNDAPVITAGGTLNYTEGNAATAIDGTILVTDADDTNLESATVQITVNYASGQDVLALPATPGIAAVFTPATGTLTLTGSATVAAYQAALRTVTYFNGSGTPSVAPRTVTWVVNDGTAPSNLATSTITVTAVNSAPVGVTDAWTTFGNTELVIDQAGPTTPFLADTTTSTFGVLDNDTDPEGDARVVAGIVGCADTTAPFVCTTTAGGSVTMETNGRFAYRPQAGVTGSDSFQYVLRDVPVVGVPVNVNVTVNLTLQERIWYVDGDVAGPGTGTSNDPFNTLPATVGDADDYIFVHASTLTGGITLQNGQKLYGEGFGLSINQALNGNPAPAVLVPAGTNPVIDATTGNAVGVLADTASGNLANIEIRGLTLSTSAASSNAIDVTSANGANVAVTISGVTVTGATAEGIDVNQGSTGTATVSMTDVTVTSTGNGIDLNATVGTLTVTSFSGLIVTGDTLGSGIAVNNVTFDATAGAPYNQVSGGAISVGDVGNPVGGAGVALTNVSGDLAFTDLDVFTANGAALVVTGTGPVNGLAGTGTVVSVAPGVGVLQSTGGPVVDVTDATVNLPLSSATVTSSFATGISLVNVASGTTAAFVSATSGSIANTSGISVNVDGGTVSLDYGGNITQTSNAAMVSVANHTAGTITFGGTLNASDGPGLVFDNADSTTSYNFTGTTTLNGGAAGIDIINGSTGTFSFGTGTTITNPTGVAFLMLNSNANVTYSGSISDNTDEAVVIDNHDSGTVTFQTGSLTSTGSGIFVANSNGGTINFNSPTIALTTGSSNAVTLDVNNVGGTINFNPAGGGNGLDISTSTGIGFSALGGGTISVQGTGNTINATGNRAIDLLDVIVGASGIAFLTTTSSGGSRNVSLTNVTGGTIALGGGSLTGAAAAAFVVGSGAPGSGGTATITYGGSITTTGAVRAVDIQDRAAGAGSLTLSGTITHSSGNATVIFLDDNAAGTITFSGVGSVLNGGTATAVSLTDNTGATINFTGNGLDIDATSGTGFLATGGGTVNVTGTGNSIATTTGTALNVANTTIGASGLTFQSISANGAGNGIVLNTTGTSGGLTVTGNGGTCTAATPTCTGGRIQNTVGADNSTATPPGTGIVLNNTRSVSLTRMRLDNHSNWAIRGTNVDGFVFDTGLVDGTNGNNDGFDEGAVSFTQLTGSASVTNSSIGGAIEHNMQVLNSSGTLNRLTVTGTTFGAMDTTFGSDGLLIESSGTAIMNVTVDSNTFTSARGDHFQYSNTTAAQTGDVVFTNNTITNAHPAVVGGGGGIRVTAGNNTGQNGSITFNVSGNSMVGARGTALAVNKLGGTGTFSGTIANNTVGAASVQGSGSLEGSGIFVLTDGGGTYTVAITGNTVRQYDNDGIFAQTGGSGVVGSGAMNLTVTGNTVTDPETQVAGALATNGFHLNGGTTVGDTYQICLALSGNTLAGSGQDTIPPGSTFGDFRLRQRQSTTVRLPGYAGAANDDAAVVTFIQGQNPGSESGVASNNSPTGGGFVGGAACQIP